MVALRIIHKKSALHCGLQNQAVLSENPYLCEILTKEYGSINDRFRKSRRSF